MQVKRGFRHLILDIIQAELRLLYVVYLKGILSARGMKQKGEVSKCTRAGSEGELQAEMEL